MRTNALTSPSFENRETFQPTAEETQYITDAYESFFRCYTVRQEDEPIMGNRTPDKFWKDSERDYAVVFDELQDENDPVKRYQSTISRDKTNVYIAHIAGSLLIPDTVAQNPEQGIDRVWSRVGSSMLYWAHKQDGWPNENGQQKSERLAHTTCVKGTAFSLDIVTKEGLESEEIPPEELYVPNLWQPNIQKQSVVFRAKLNITFEEAEAMFGDCENFEYVHPGVSWIGDTFIANDGLKTSYQGIVQQDKVSILYVWKKARPSELKQMVKDRKVWSNATRGTYYNVIINGVPMYPVDNVSPYKHGYLNISKCIFEILRSDYFYGNSVPNKMMEDKKWRDDWKTLMRFKGKLGALPPQLIIGGAIDDQIILPSAQTSVPEGVEVQAVPGITGITNSDIQLMSMADSEIDRATVAPSAAGQRSDQTQTARAEVIQAAASQKMLEPFTRQYGYFMQSRSFPILLSLLQFVSRQSIKKIVVPDQILADGSKGAFEIIFKDVTDIDDMEKLSMSIDMLKQEKTSREQKQPKDIAYVSPSQIRDIKFFLFSDTTGGDNNIIRQQDFAKDLATIFPQYAQSINMNEALKYYFQIKNYPERLLATGSPEAQGGMPPGATGAPEVSPTPGDAMAGAASEATTGQGLPALA